MRTPEEVRAEAAELAKRKRLPEFTKILLDWDHNVVELTLATGEKRQGTIAVNHDFTVVFVGVETEEETAYLISSVIGVRHLRDEPIEQAARPAPRFQRDQIIGYRDPDTWYTVDGVRWDDMNQRWIYDVTAIDSGATSRGQTMGSARVKKS